MAYDDYTWTASSLMSGRALNHLESQWDEIKSDADNYFHDTRYYTVSLAEDTFFSRTWYTGFDADKLDGLDYEGVVSTTLPIGTVAMWAGAEIQIPAHWHLCDGGTYGGKVSPDLRDRFVVGAGGTYDPGDTGGPATYNGNVTPAVTVTIGSHTLSTAEIPSHTHPYAQYCPNQTIEFNGSLNLNNYNESRNTAILEQVVGGGSHTHAGSTVAFDPYESRPPCFALCYIMKYE